MIAFILIKFVLYPVLGFALGTDLPLVAVMSGSMTHDLADGTVCGVTPQNYDASFDAYWRTCGNWYASRNITREAFQAFPFVNGFDKGDIMLLLGVDRGSTDVGDIIVFQARGQYPIIHRVIWKGTDESGKASFATKGDHNPAQISQYIVVNNQGAASRCASPQGEPLPCGYGAPVTRETPGALALIDETHVTHDTIIGRAVFRVPWLGWIRVGVGNLINLASGQSLN